MQGWQEEGRRSAQTLPGMVPSTDFRVDRWQENRGRLCCRVGAGVVRSMKAAV